MLTHIGLDNGKGTVHNISIGVGRYANAKVIGAVRRITIKPGSIVNITITGRRMRDGFWSLMNGEVI